MSTQELISYLYLIITGFSLKIPNVALVHYWRRSQMNLEYSSSDTTRVESKQYDFYISDMFQRGTKFFLRAQLLSTKNSSSHLFKPEETRTFHIEMSNLNWNSPQFNQSRIAVYFFFLELSNFCKFQKHTTYYTYIMVINLKGRTTYRSAFESTNNKYLDS